MAQTRVAQTSCLTAERLRVKLNGAASGWNRYSNKESQGRNIADEHKIRCHPGTGRRTRCGRFAHGAAQTQSKPAAPDPRIDKLLDQNEQILKNQDQILKDLDDLKKGVLQLRYRSS